MDPYRSHLVMTVNQQINTTPGLNVGGLQIDGSAQSFISQSV